MDGKKNLPDLAGMTTFLIPRNEQTFLHSRLKWESRRTDITASCGNSIKNSALTARSAIIGPARQGKFWKLNPSTHHNVLLVRRWDTSSRVLAAFHLDSAPNRSSAAGFQQGAGKRFWTRPRTGGGPVGGVRRPLFFCHPARRDFP